jgi:hypothetical protein
MVARCVFRSKTGGTAATDYICTAHVRRGRDRDSSMAGNFMATSRSSKLNLASCNTDLGRLLKMLCPCRTAPLRTFIRTVAQLHLQDVSASQQSLQRANPRTTNSPSALISSTTTPARNQYRAFHKTRSLQEHAQAVAGSIQSVASGSIEATLEGTSALQSASNGQSTDLEQSQAEVSPKIWSRKPRGGSPGATASEATSTESKKPRREPDKRKTSPQPEDQTFPPKHERWQLHKAALKDKFPDGWRPRKRLSPDALVGIRALHEQFPEEFSTEVLAKKFEVSPEAIRRILRSKWSPSTDEEIDRQERWFRRGKSVWARYAELGLKPPQKWRREGIDRDPGYFEARRERRERIEAMEAEIEAEEDRRRRLAETLM